MKRHSQNTLVSLTALALGATVLLTGCSEDAAGSTAETASAPVAPAQSSDTTATGATAAQTSELLASLTHEEMEELISGSTTLADRRAAVPMELDGLQQACHYGLFQVGSG